MVYAKCCFGLLWNQLFSNSTAHVQFSVTDLLFLVLLRMCSIVTDLLYIPFPAAHVQHCSRPYIPFPAAHVQHCSRPVIPCPTAHVQHCDRPFIYSLSCCASAAL